MPGEAKGTGASREPPPGCAGGGGGRRAHSLCHHSAHVAGVQGGVLLLLLRGCVHGEELRTQRSRSPAGAWTPPAPPPSPQSDLRPGRSRVVRAPSTGTVFGVVTPAQAGAHVCTHRRTHPHVCTHTDAHPHVCTQMHTPTHVCTHPPHVCTHRRTHPHTCAHTDAHTHMCAHSQSPLPHQEHHSLDTGPRAWSGNFTQGLSF